MRTSITIIALAAFALAAPAAASGSARTRAETKIERTVKRAYPGTTAGRGVYAHCHGRRSRWNCSYEIWNGYDDCYEYGEAGLRCPLVRYTGYGRVRGSHVFISRPRR